MVVHLWTPPASDSGLPSPHLAAAAPRVGFVVSRAVGPAVTRNLVKRRLRHLARERVGALPPGSMLVVRALPAAASAGHAELARELDRSLAKVGVAAGDAAAEAVISR
jgi:ribonuclease P protein component